MTDVDPTGRPGRLSATSTVVDGIHVISLAGEIDRDSAEVLRDALPRPDATLLRVVVDLGQVSFLDSTGINLFISTHNTFAQNGGWLRLAAPTASVLRVLQIVGIDTVIDCCPTLRQALST
ncbi:MULTISPECIES: STAS domain-containing protein [Streptomyces]|uniref:STAS domain-containing protein n=1 Tax=Streptomyces TaxID=1883 RepID=UPI00201CE7EA|nr:STAS domain-containing protein [Streptomyces panaciradicis]MCL6671920.1 STAS domain-containing protein [Streptomyces panaciradicis]